MNILRKIKAYSITILLLMAIIYLSLMPTNPEKHQKLFDIPGIDKIVHAIMYASLMISLLRDYFRRHIFKARLFYFFALALYGTSVCIELIQHFFTSERSGDFLDTIANLSGIIIGIAIYQVFKKKIPFLYPFEIRSGQEEI